STFELEQASVRRSYPRCTKTPRRSSQRTTIWGGPQLRRTIIPPPHGSRQRITPSPPSSAVSGNALGSPPSGATTISLSTQVSTPVQSRRYRGDGGPSNAG